jgi:hypothetical protein
LVRLALMIREFSFCSSPYGDIYIICDTYVNSNISNKTAREQ